MSRSWHDAKEPSDGRVRIPGFGTLTLRGEMVLAILIVLVLIVVLAFAGWIEVGS